MTAIIRTGNARLYVDKSVITQCLAWAYTVDTLWICDNMQVIRMYVNKTHSHV